MVKDAKSPTSSERVLAKTREELALEMRVEGLTYRDIAATLGVSVSTAHEAVKRGLEELSALSLEKAEELRAVELERLEAQHTALWPRRGDEKVADVLRKLSESRRKLLGIDGPHRIKLDVGESAEEILRELLADDEAGVEGGSEDSDSDVGVVDMEDV